MGPGLVPLSFSQVPSRPHDTSHPGGPGSMFGKGCWTKIPEVELPLGVRVECDKRSGLSAF